MAGRLAGRVAMVTGAASGIGKRCAERFVEEGARVLLTDIQDDKGREAAAALGPNAAYRRCDVTVESDIAAAVEDVCERFGPIDVLLSNAGAGGWRGPIEDFDTAWWDRSMALLLRSCMLGAKHAARVMKPRKSGSIVNIASTAGLVPGATPHDYSTAKGAVVHFTQGLAQELGEHGVRANAICPGYVITPLVVAGMGLGMQAAEAQRDRVNEAFGAVHPMPRAGWVDDIANAALFLASDESGFVNGLAMAVDGGLHAGISWSGHRNRMAGIARSLSADGNSMWDREIARGGTKKAAD